MEGNYHHHLVELARSAVELYLREGRKLDPPRPQKARKAGVFVSLKEEGRLRGCIGTYSPATESLEEEVVENAISAATRDPRFPPLRLEELEGLEFSVDVLADPEPVESVRELDPAVYGVIVKSGWRTGLLLPDLPGVDTVEQQVDIACRKAGIQPEEQLELFRFRVERYR